MMYYSKCINPNCGAVFKHQQPLSEMSIRVQYCTCGMLLEVATEAEWLEADQEEETKPR